MKAMLIFAALTVTLAMAQTPTPTPIASPSPTPDISVMVARLKAAKIANKPFTIFYQGGLSVNVANSNYIVFNPSGKFTYVNVFTGDDTMYSIPVKDIIKLVLVSNYPFD